MYIYVLGTVKTLAGTTTCISGIITAGTCVGGFNDGVGTNAKFNGPSYLTLDPTGSLLYIGDSSNNEIRAITLSAG